MTGGLILNLEAVWTVVLARIVFGEFLGRRVAVALVLMVVGGALLTVRNAGSVSVHFIGILAVVAATVAWAIDNTASRQLSELQPASVVAAKGGLGALTTGVLALAFNEAMPKPWQFAILLLAGATGYGASLRIYLLAQRRIGAARTASVFALAPFIGAAVGAAFVPGQLSWEVFVAAGLFGAGVALHASERHSHRHQHDAVEHEHTHSHQDGHHSHQHSPPVEKHSHVHRHEPLEHDHDHGMDLHHGHRH